MTIDLRAEGHAHQFDDSAITNRPAVQFDLVITLPVRSHHTSGRHRRPEWRRCAGRAANVSTSFMFYFVSCAVAVATIVLRVTRWRSLPQSRPFTIALSLLLGGVVLRHPALLGTGWVQSAYDTNVHLANFTCLLGDLLLAAAAGYIGSVVLQAWGLSRVRRWLAYGIAATALAMTILWAISDAPLTPIRYVGDLGGPALIYTYIAATTILIANAAVLISILVVRAARKIRLALMPLALAAVFGVIGNVLRIGTHGVGGVFVTLRDRLEGPLSAAMILLYSISGLIGYAMTAHLTASETSPPVVGCDPARGRHAPRRSNACADDLFNRVRNE
ncbi:hypothetical protein ACFYO1_01740 [Nocardia sp. NPDC006044]|uniref:hypothetical protein n=1 Tax=Nocardia sp. NPDC006044 TaxID=3364306 RepID=UPI003694901E